MASKSCFEISLILGLVLMSTNAEGNVFNVLSYGAKADGVTDDSKAFLNAWTDACKWNGKATLFIPLKVYMVHSVDFVGPCKGSLTFKMEGVIKAPTDPKLFCKDAWILFQHVNDLAIEGGGTLDGQGASAWKQTQCTRPATLKLESMASVTVHNIQSKNSKMFHFDVYNCNKVTFSHVTITAPGDSPNTDGIHISDSSNIQVFDSNIGTGDDCISIYGGSQNINISGVTCGPGHGISIGSLGELPHKVLKDIHVQHCTLTATQNGVRIKTLASSNICSATTIKFQDIIMNNVKNPIIINQHYCQEPPCKKQPSSVQIKDVTFNNIRGTSNSVEAVTFNCSASYPCQGLILNDINLTYNGGREPTIATCSYAHGKAYGKELPPSCLM